MASQGNAHSATGPASVVLDAGVGNLVRNITLKVNGPAADSVVALETSPQGTTWTEMSRVTGANWANVRSDHSQRQVRANVINLGTGGAPLATVVNATP